MHGGNYVFGSGGVVLYDSPQFAADQNFILVTMNYRLGVLGGLFTGDEGETLINGNFQFMDQIMALQWVNDNIELFSGNKDEITIMGQSAGAASVASMLAANSTWGLFQKAIVHSNPYGLLAADKHIALELSDLILKNVSCPTGAENSKEQLKCLQNLPVEKILAANGTHLPPIGQYLALFMPWTPISKTKLLPIQPIVAAQTGKFKKGVPIVIGDVANETLMYIWAAQPKPMLPIEYEIFIISVFGPKIAEAIFAMYGPVPKDQQNDCRHFLNLVATDYIFYCPSQFATESYAKNGAGWRIRRILNVMTMFVMPRT